MKKILTRYFLLAAFLVPGANFLYAQDTSPVKNNSVIVHKDPRLDLLVARQAQINEATSRDSRKTGKGYRLMVISTNSRDEAIAARTTVYTYFPELKAYLWHQSPYYKVKAGNFKERKDAEAYQEKLSVYFPRGVYIMNDIVEFKLDRSQDEDL
jgi:hypothetical protein